MKSIAIVILNWNGKKWLEKFLPNVIKHSQIPNCEIIVADNGSTDDTIAFLSVNFPMVKQILLDKNYGFTGGYNRALAQVKTDYYVLLNSDIEVTENWLRPVIERLESDEKIAVCQPKILAYHQKTHFEYAGASGGMIDFLGYPFCRGRMFDTVEKDEAQYNDARPVFWATGACLFVKAELYHKAGGLDERFFAHMEEIDLCWRLQNMGYTIWVEPSATVFHVGGGTLQKSNPRKTFLNFRNSIATMFKNLPLFEAIVKMFIRLNLDGIAGIVFLLKGEWRNTLAIIKAHFSFYTMLPYLIKKRKEFPQKKPLKLMKGFYSKSIVWEHFT
ncbi:MAG: glycosyltransferase family 2 protein [Chitinophagales bacterium]